MIICPDNQLIKFNYLAVGTALSEITGHDYNEFLSVNISGKKLLVFICAILNY